MPKRTDSRRPTPPRRKAGKTWGGRFRQGTHPLTEAYTLSLPVDRRLWREEIAASGRRRILVVDDDESVNDFVSKVVAEVDGEAEVAAARDGFEAGAKVISFKPDVVILDLRMPGLDGFQVCERIKSDPAVAGATVIGITGYFSEEHESRFISCGGSKLLKKPLDVDALKKAVGEALRRRAKRPSASRPSSWTG